jgi:hypothetical protein
MEIRHGTGRPHVGRGERVDMFKSLFLAVLAVYLLLTVGLVRDGFKWRHVLAVSDAGVSCSCGPCQAMTYTILDAENK